MVWSAVLGAVTITSFVGAMMILVEYVNVLTEDRWRRALAGSRWSQYFVAAALGSVPGCLGAFVVVTLFIHRGVTLGAVVACMVATSGDEAFVMLALFPGPAILLMAVLAVVGVLAGMATDVVVGRPAEALSCDELAVHGAAEACRCFDARRLWTQLRRPSFVRGFLLAAAVLHAVALSLGVVGPREWTWIRMTLLGVTLFAVFIVTTVPDHFLESHLWSHVAVRHVPRVFAWTLVAMLAIEQLNRWTGAASLVEEKGLLVLLAAAALGILPESGPHLVFVNLYDQGMIPASTLVTSSIVQDGHGMLPLLAHSLRDFSKVKAINLVVGLLVGGLLLALGR